ncbi:MAG: hypothetical protein K2Y56_05215 [Methylobacterium sp.]|uniref:hypothetical protein n=1 Tax=Methylobacterium sp. TaxID=409 RepID=UPI0025DBC360|nr:hypothetical protein [Methylobacterium sp.]MBX9930922.1 hypothetical protein [Methylobacterium sp.]
MRVWVLACAMLASLAWPSLAKDFALPAEGPAVTLSVPNNWDITELENEIATIAPDGYLVVTIGFGKRSELNELIKGSKDYLKESKVSLSVKPVELTMDFAGIPAWVQRYATKGQNGKTIVDLITVEASRDRVVLITVMGSNEERKDNEAALSGILSSLRFPGEGGSAAVQPVPPQPPKVAAVTPAPATAPPFAVRRAVFVKRRPDSFGDVDVRPNDAFTPGEALLTYIEPVGQATLPADGGKKRFGVIVDFEIRTRDGKVLGGQKAMLDRDLTMPGDASDPKFYIDAKVDLTGAAPGAYVLTYILRDKLSDRVTSIDQPFTIVTAPAPATRPAEAQADVGCANPVAREGMIEAVNQRPAFRDAKKTLKALADPELVRDARPKSLTCRYTAIIAETKASGLVETRQKITFVMTTDDKGEVDADYTIE